MRICPNTTKCASVLILEVTAIMLDPKSSHHYIKTEKKGERRISSIKIETAIFFQPLWNLLSIYIITV